MITKDEAVAGMHEGKKMTKMERIFFLNQLGVGLQEISTLVSSPRGWCGAVLKYYIDEPKNIEKLYKKYPKAIV